MNKVSNILCAPVSYFVSNTGVKTSVIDQNYSVKTPWLKTLHTSLIREKESKLELTGNTLPPG